MTRYLLIYRGDPEARASMPPMTEEQIDQENAAWNAWAAKVGPGIVDFGTPTEPVSPGADPTLGGYSMIEAESAEHVESLLDGHPHRLRGGTIDVYELQLVPGM